MVVEMSWFVKSESTWFNIVKYIVDNNGEPLEIDFPKFKELIKIALRPFVLTYYAQSEEERIRLGQGPRRQETVRQSYILIRETQSGFGPNHREIAISYRDPELTTRYQITLSVWYDAEENIRKLVNITGPNLSHLNDDNVRINTLEELVSEIVVAVYHEAGYDAPDVERISYAREDDPGERQTQEEIDREMEELHPGTLREGGREVVSRGFRELSPYQQRQETARKEREKKKKRKGPRPTAARGPPIREEKE
jgi:hypothetical protein